MKPLQYINKLFCTLSTFCCGQILYSQVPKEATLPLEIAELIGLKMCDDYTLSYFVMNVSKDGYNSYNHGIIEQEKDKKRLKFKKANNVYFDDFQGKDAWDEPHKERLSQIDSVYSPARGTKFEIKIKEQKIEYSDVISQPMSFTKDVQTLNGTISVTEENGAIEKQWKNDEGEQFKNTVIYHEERKISDITENITKKIKKSNNYHYDTDGVVSKVIHYNWFDIETDPPVIQTLYFEYDDDKALKKIVEGNNLKSYIDYSRKDKVIVHWYISNFNKFYLIEYVLDSNGFIYSYKCHIVTEEQYTSQTRNRGDQISYKHSMTSKHQLKSHGIIICK